MAILRRWSRILFCAAFLLAPQTRLAAQDSAEVSVWNWQDANPQGKRLSIDFARGTVRVIRRPGPLQVRVVRRAVRGYATEAAISVSEGHDAFTITDHYPTRSVWSWREELPPVEPRGDFWLTVVYLETTVWAPETTEIRAVFLYGTLGMPRPE